MATNTEILVNKNRLLRAKVETTPGTFVSMDDTNNIPIVDLDWRNNHETQDNPEANATLDEGLVTVNGSKPSITGKVLLRGGGGVTTKPIYDPLMQACGWDPTTETILPSSGSADCSSGTTSTCTIDAAAESFPTLAADVAKLVGRVVSFTANPASGIAVIRAATIDTGIITLTLDRILGSALGATTDLQLLPGIMYRQISTGIKAVSLACFRDGKERQFNGGRGTSKINLTGNGQGEIEFELRAAFQADNDTALPDAATSFASLPSAPRWCDTGSAYLDGVPIAVTSFDVNQQADLGQHRDPNTSGGLLPTKLTGRKVRGTIQFNTQLKATHDWFSKLEGNTLMGFSAVLNAGGTAGTRIAIMLPNVKFLEENAADFEGLADDAWPYQAYLGGTIFFF